MTKWKQNGTRKHFILSICLLLATAAQMFCFLKVTLTMYIDFNDIAWKQHSDLIGAKHNCQMRCHNIVYVGVLLEKKYLSHAGVCGKVKKVVHFFSSSLFAQSVPENLTRWRKSVLFSTICSFKYSYSSFFRIY